MLFFLRLDPSVLLAWKLSCVTIKSLVSSGVPIMAFSSIGLLLMGMSYYRDGARTQNLCGQVKFMLSKKATKIDEIFTVNLTLTT